MAVGGDCGRAQIRLPPDRPVQRRQRDGGRRGLARLGVAFDVACSGSKLLPPPGRMQRVVVDGRPAGGGRLCAYARCAEQRAAGAAADRRGARRRVVVRLRRRRRARHGQAGVDGRGGRALADRLVITTDNPRGEDAVAIVADDRAGADARAVADRASIARRRSATRWRAAGIRRRGADRRQGPRNATRTSPACDGRSRTSRSPAGAEARRESRVELRRARR